MFNSVMFTKILLVFFSYFSYLAQDQINMPSTSFSLGQLIPLLCIKELYNWLKFCLKLTYSFFELFFFFVYFFRLFL